MTLRQEAEDRTRFREDGDSIYTQFLLLHVQQQYDTKSLWSLGRRRGQYCSPRLQRWVYQKDCGSVSTGADGRMVSAASLALEIGGAAPPRFLLDRTPCDVWVVPEDLLISTGMLKKIGFRMDKETEHPDEGTVWPW